jgi:hypothetical protein
LRFEKIPIPAAKKCGYDGALGGSSRSPCPREKPEKDKAPAIEQYQGFVYFQGYFFRRPQTMKTPDMPANQMHYLRMLQEVSCPELDLSELEGLVKAAASVCYRLLRYLNSAISDFRAKSIRCGMRCRFWESAMCGGGCVWWPRWAQGRRKPATWSLSALVRGRFGELLARRVPHGESDLFLLGAVLTDRCHARNADVGRAG